MIEQNTICGPASMLTEQVTLLISCLTSVLYFPIPAILVCLLERLSLGTG